MFALVLGVLVMTAILAGAPMYLSSIESLGLRSTLVTLSASHRNMQIVVEELPLTDLSVSSATERVDSALSELGDLQTACNNIARELSTNQQRHSKLGAKNDVYEFYAIQMTVDLLFHQ